jgi:hypothetical protein
VLILEKENQNNDEKNLKISLVIIVIGLLVGYFTFDYIKLKTVDINEFVLKSDKDSMYNNILLVKKYKERREFDDLLTYLLSKRNVDLLSKQMAIRFVKENNYYTYTKRLKEIQEEFRTIPLDSTWTYKITDNKYRSNKLKNASIIPFLEEAIRCLEK